MPVQVRKGRFVVLTECHVGDSSAFSMAGERLWLGRVDHRGPNSAQLLMYKPQRNAAGKQSSSAQIKETRTQKPTDNTVMIELGTQLDQALHWTFIAAVLLGILAVAMIPLMSTQGSMFIP